MTKSFEEKIIELKNLFFPDNYLISGESITQENIFQIKGLAQEIVSSSSSSKLLNYSKSLIRNYTRI